MWQLSKFFFKSKYLQNDWILILLAIFDQIWEGNENCQNSIKKFVCHIYCYKYILHIHGTKTFKILRKLV